MELELNINKNACVYEMKCMNLIVQYYFNKNEMTEALAVAKLSLNKEELL